MRKGISLLTAIILLLGLAYPAFATEFVPSITYKPTPEVDKATMTVTEQSGEQDVIDLQGCIVITSITQAEEKTTDITQEDRDLLLDVYDKLSDGSMDLFVLPEEYLEENPQEETYSDMGLSYENKNYVVVQLVDVSFAKYSCVDMDHYHLETLEREDVNATLDFDLGVSADAVVVVLHFHDGKWMPVTSTVNNGDGTVTCVFEHFCPVAFCIEAEGLEAPQQADFSWLIWLVLLVVCAGLVAFLVIYREKNKKKMNTEE